MNCTDGGERSVTPRDTIIPQALKGRRNEAVSRPHIACLCVARDGTQATNGTNATRDKRHTTREETIDDEGHYCVRSRVGRTVCLGAAAHPEGSPRLLPLVSRQVNNGHAMNRLADRPPRQRTAKRDRSVASPKQMRISRCMIRGCARPEIFVFLALANFRKNV